MATTINIVGRQRPQTHLFNSKQQKRPPTYSEWYELSRDTGKSIEIDRIKDGDTITVDSRK